MRAMATAKGKASRVPTEEALLRLRIPMIRKVALTLKGQREEVFAIDVSLTGLFIERKEPMVVNEKVDVEFGVPGNELAIKARCRVAWCHRKGAQMKTKTLPAGIGLQYVEIADSDKARLREHVLEYCRRHPKTRQFHPSWPEDELAGTRVPTD
jgi:Tfp pilus assembly protein PilZ